MLTAALRYAELNWAVFPCIPGDKRPAVKHGSHEATTDPKQIRRWWEGEVDTRSNVAIATGSASRLYVVDLDGEQGIQSCIDWISGGRSMKALWQMTPTGGWHAVFRMPAGTLANSARRLAPGIDTRGEGGYILAAPSVHPNGGRYRWGEKIRPPTLPGWLLGMLRPLPIEKAAPDAPGTIDGDAYTQVAVSGEVEAVTHAVEGMRNHQLNTSAFNLGQLVTAGYLSDDQVYEQLRPAAQVAGLEAREIERTIQSGLEAGKREPRGR